MLLRRGQLALGEVNFTLDTKLDSWRNVPEDGRKGGKGTGKRPKNR